MKNFLRDALITLTIAVIIFLGLQMTVQKFVVQGPSMNPSFNNGQLLLVNKVVYKFHEPERGDVIIFHPPEYMNGDLIKRIIGLPNETVQIEDGVVYIHKDGEVFPLDEPYITETILGDFNGVTIPPGEYFVLGDNRNNSSDSRSGWTTPRENIIGKVWLSIWPPGNWGLAGNYSLQGQISNASSN